MQSAQRNLGLEFHVHGKEEKELYHGQLALDVSDLPANRKLNGYMSYTSILFMCTLCEVTLFSLTDPQAFNPSST